ncbi:MAG: septal ring lytic transglycosylase RlpA family protein [Ferruginibacter sp.]
MILFKKESLRFLFCCVLLLICCNMETAAQSSTKPSKKITKTLYGTASFYGNKFNGRKTANGEIFSQAKFTCACNVLPIGTWIKLTNMRNGKTVTVKVNDRLHPRMKRLVDLTKAAAQKLGFVSNGVARVKAEVLGKNRPR